ncbi:MAG TPA: ABC transporter permease [Candidatus Sulfotelmatobacter sp.]|nr:ABC transporter permease [Candidatus Sulfotelmatobacter sp.]
MIAALAQDFRYAIRQLRKNPGFAAIAVLTLALGIGATTGIFTVVSGVLLKPLDYPQPESLVTVHVQAGKHGDRWGFSYPDFRDCQRQCQSFEGVAAWTYGGGTISAPGEPEYVDGRLISASLFSVLRVPVVMGRSFAPAEDQAGAAPVAIISTRLWQRRYAANPKAVGMPLTYEGKAYTVVGIAPPGLQLDGDADVFTPLGQATEPRMWRRDAHFLHVDARLRRGVTLSAAQAELGVFSTQLQRQYADSNADITFVPHTLQSELVKDVRPTLWLLLIAVSVVLLIACVNVASLLLTRVVSRSHEFSLRLALGARHGRLFTQCLIESGVLGICGGSLGLFLAVLGTGPFLRFWPDRLPRADEVHADWRVLLFAITTSTLTALVFGVIPAVRANRSAIEETLRSRSRTIAGSARKPLTGFVISQIALALVLLSAAGVMGRTLLTYASLNPGIDISNTLAARVAFSPAVLSHPPQARAAWQELMDSVRRVPAVQSVALTDIVPMREGENVLAYGASAAPVSLSQEPEALASAVTPSYLQVMRLALLRGRFFNDNDRLDSPQVIVIDENMARHAFGKQDPVGKLLWVRALGDRPVQVIGVVGHVRHWGLAADDLSTVHDQLYYPLAQVPDQLVRFFSSVLSVVVRTNVPPLNTVEALQKQARGATGDQTLYEVRTMEQLVSASLARQRFLLLLFAIFAGLALLLACVGIYSVIAYLTGQRVPEFGVRIALGARSSDVIRLVLRESLAMIVIGIGIGLLASFGSGRILQRLVPGVQTAQGLILAAVLPALILAALFACYIPARRAGKVDPAVSLRSE